jgi:hypothetical protein
MDGTSSPLRAIRKVRDIIAEMNDAHRRVVIRRMSLDSYLHEPNKAPATYPEFLARSRAPMVREPSARDRAAGQSVTGWLPPGLRG